MDALNNILEHFNKTTVLVIGDLMLDRYMYGNVSRLSPEAPVPLVDISHEIYRLGGAAHAGEIIHGLGGDVVTVGVIGNDWFGRQLTGLLKEDAINTTGITECNDRPTTVKTRIIAERQYILRLDREIRSPLSQVQESALLRFLQDTIVSVDVILISDYNKGIITKTVLKEIIALSKKYDKPIVVYPKIDQSFDYKGIHTFITTLENAVELTKIRQINETSIRNIGQWLLSSLECQFILISRGKEGMTLFDKKGSVTHVPPVTKDVIPVTGNIDTVACITALSLSSCNNNLTADIVRLANVGADIVPGHLESTVITQTDIRLSLKKSGGC